MKNNKRIFYTGRLSTFVKKAKFYKKELKQLDNNAIINKEFKSKIIIRKNKRK